MVDSTQKHSLEQDFGNKRKSYFESNYGVETYQNSLRRERRDQINQWVEQVIDSRRVLDVGCGPAILYAGAYDRCEIYFAMDIVKTNLNEASENHEKVEAIEADLDSLGWKSDSPSLIICSGCIEYSEAGMQNVHRLSKMLSAGGALIVTFPNILSPYRIWFEYGYRQLVRAIAPSKTRPAHSRMLFRQSDVCELLKNEGLEIVATRRLGYCFIPPPFENWFPKTSYHIRTWLEKHVPVLGPLSSEFAVFARKL